MSYLVEEIRSEYRERGDKFNCVTSIGWKVIEQNALDLASFLTRDFFKKKMTRAPKIPVGRNGGGGRGRKNQLAMKVQQSSFPFSFRFIHR